MSREVCKHGVEVTAERLRELFNYDPLTGNFTRLVKTSNGIKVGDVAGSLHKGYLRFGIDGRRYMAHRLVWLYVHGRWPIDQLDHIDGKRANNRLINLRESTNSENMQNQRKARSDSRSGYLGTWWHQSSGRWQAGIVINGERTHLGTFLSPELAHVAYLEAKRKMHPRGAL